MRGHVKTCLGLNAIRGKASALSPFALRKASASAAASCREPTPTTLKTPRSELAHKRCAIDDDLVILSGCSGCRRRGPARAALSDTSNRSSCHSHSASDSRSAKSCCPRRPVDAEESKTQWCIIEFLHSVKSQDTNTQTATPRTRRISLHRSCTFTSKRVIHVKASFGSYMSSDVPRPRLRP